MNGRPLPVRAMDRARDVLLDEVVRRLRAESDAALRAAARAMSQARHGAAAPLLDVPSRFPPTESRMPSAGIPDGSRRDGGSDDA